jgi:hypothetical protein
VYGDSPFTVQVSRTLAKGYSENIAINIVEQFYLDQRAHLVSGTKVCSLKFSHQIGGLYVFGYKEKTLNDISFCIYRKTSTGSIGYPYQQYIYMYLHYCIREKRYLP